MTQRPRVLVTGATGFVGTALMKRLIAERWPGLRSSTRRQIELTANGGDRVQIGDINGGTDWSRALGGIDCVVHLAARVHQIRESSADPLAEFRRINVEGTLNLAGQAVASGVRRFVYLSTIKVNGDDGTFRDGDPPHPGDAYAISKYEAEVGLWKLAETTGVEVVVIRPPLVYGPGVKANFRALMRAVRKGIPLPLGAISNRRSMIAVENLVDFIIEGIVQPAAANKTFLVSDNETLSVTELVERLAGAMGRRPRLVSVPGPLLMFAATVVGKRAAAKRLLGSLVIDGSSAREVLGWTPPVSVNDALRRTVEGQW